MLHQFIAHAPIQGQGISKFWQPAASSNQAVCMLTRAIITVPDTLNLLRCTDSWGNYMCPDASSSSGQYNQIVDAINRAELAAIHVALTTCKEAQEEA